MVWLRKLYLQYLQVNYLNKNSSKTIRSREQSRVLRGLILNPRLLFSNNKIDNESLVLAKYYNHLNVIAGNDRLYKSAKKTLKGKGRNLWQNTPN